MANGKIGVSTKDLFPIIKKFLYSDHDIFLREIVSNAVDATQKLKILSRSGEFQGDSDGLQVRVHVDKEAGTLTVSDSGIGMTSEEVEKYINQIAFSGAEDFLKAYEDSKGSIIGHFGLGFYSSFMVSDQVEIVTRSYKDGAQAVRWTCNGDTEYELNPCEKAERGTDIIMHISEAEKDFLDEEKIRTLLEKYCRFLPVEIVCGKEKEWKDGAYHTTDKDHVVNDTHPAWTKKPNEMSDADYQSFYQQLYPYAGEPLFHIHLNVDYPFNLTGILYFPKITQQVEIQRNKIQLYANQVFITDSVESIVPDFLTLLHGVIDSPDIPLNVSRSYLQSDANVKKISGHITKKVADSLLEIFKDRREDFEKKWDDLKMFVQYGVLSDEKFAERALEVVLWKNTEGVYLDRAAYEAKIKSEQTDKDGKLVILYTTDPDEQYAYIEKAKAKGYDVLEMSGYLDTHIINYLEQKNSDTRYVRVDSDVIERLIPKSEVSSVSLSDSEQTALREVFEGRLPQGSAQYAVQFEAMGETAEAVMITRSEMMRRMKDLSASNPGMAFYGSMPDHYNVVVNSEHPLIHKLLSEEHSVLNSELSPLEAQISEQESQKAALQALNADSKDLPQADRERLEAMDKQMTELKQRRQKLRSEFGMQNLVLGQLIDLALLANGLLKGESLSRFVRNSLSTLEKVQ